jgi:hypothetical protein
MGAESSLEAQVKALAFAIIIISKNNKTRKGF